MTIEQKRLELIKSFKEGNQNAFNELAEGLISVRNIMIERNYRYGRIDRNKKTYT